MMRVCNVGFSLLAVALLAAGGCVTETAKVGGAVVAADGTATNSKAALNNPALADPCAMRLQDISGVLLQYIALHRHLPTRLEELPPLADIGQQLELICPASGKPYEYSPAGLVAEAGSKKIIIYDPTPAHDGQRWCVFMANDSLTGAAQSVEVLAVPEKSFQLFRPVGQ
jgi:hypothetical protein